MKKSVLITIVAVAVLAIAGYFVLQSEPQTTAEEHDHAAHAGEAGEDHGAEAATAGDAHAEELHAEEGQDHGESEDNHEGHGHEEGVPEGGSHADEVIRLSDEHLLENDVTFAKAGPGSIRFEIELPGEIVLNANKVAHIVPRFPGIAQRVFKDLGDEVREGEVLAIIQSNQSVAPYEVKSLVSGTIIEKHLTLGEFVRDDADIYVVADLSTVWAKISVYAKYLPQIKRALKVRLMASGIDEAVEGVIDYVGPIVGEKTRTGSARVVVQNSKRHWQPGLFVTARITVDQFTVPLAVPDDAIQTVEGKPSVFVRAEGGFTVRSVDIGRSDGKTVEILAGLAPGEEYASANSFLLKAERGKSEAGHDH